MSQMDFLDIFTVHDEERTKAKYFVSRMYLYRGDSNYEEVIKYIDNEVECKIGSDKGVTTGKIEKMRYDAYLKYMAGRQTG